MKKAFEFIKENLLFISSLFLLFFIPLYPKLPVIGVSHTWVYVRAEDFIVAAVLTYFLFLVLFRKVRFKTPLTIPMLTFWLIGAIATFHGVLVFFPNIANVFSNVALLSLFRRIEYMSLFFVAYLGVKDKKKLNWLIGVLAITLFSIIIYGLGQKYLGFPAFLTGNEEFAKGIALRISTLGRITSTFAGHYDLAAYLVLVVPIFASLIFGTKNLLLRVSFLALSLAGFGLLFLTVSRVSFFVLTLSLLLLLILQKKKIIIALLLAATAIFLLLSPRLIQRFGNTVTEVDVLVDANTGSAISQVIEVPKKYFKDKLVLREEATPEEAKTNPLTAVYPYKSIPDPAEVLVQANVPTGETLPQGTGYINLTLSPIVKKVPNYFTEKTIDKNGTSTTEIRAYEGGNYIIKRAKAYDLSFTTRFQGEWPRTIDSFLRNVFIGSGYGSVSLAVDNDYLRLLGETGIFGFSSFVLIFIIAAIYIWKILPGVESTLLRSFVLGFALGTFGLLLNGSLIDVFEASKVAFTYWLLMGLTLGILSKYKSEEIDIFKELKQVLVSRWAVLFYFLLITVALFSPLISNYFVGDDFTWLRWSTQAPHNLLEFFTNSNGFFYRPGAKLYFLLMYKLFWLNQTVYHVMSIILHFAVVALFFAVLNKTLKSYVLSVIAVFLFLILSSYEEVIFWISSTGFLLSSIFSLLSILSFIYWKEKKKKIYLIFALFSIFISPLFHELGVVTPFLVVAYDFVFGERGKRIIKNIYFLILSPLIPYAVLRIFSNSHWFGGDYSYNIAKLPFNFVGNALGYFMLELAGPQSLNLYERIRNVLRENIFISLIGVILVAIFVFWFRKRALSKLDENEKRVVVFGFLFFIISLLPFLGLGNIASRYSYLSSMGFVLPMAVVIRRSFVYIKTLGDKLTTLIIIVLASVILLSTQLFQISLLHQDWRVAGEKTRSFLISFESVYKETWKGRHMNFYFVNTPIKNGQAWVFPVGLADALWFSFPQQDVSVYNVAGVDDSFFKSINTKNSVILKFDDYGRVEEIFQGQK